VLDAAQFDWLRQLAEASADPGLLRSFVDQYLDQAATQVGQLRYAAGRGDIAEVQLLAHGLGGTSATMGAAGVASACALLEDAAAHGELTAPEGLDRICSEVAWASAALLAQAPAGAS
ncbi:MAG: Hpt domain, partial [Acidimicrobiaceae bacterium]|nr:Hpt domain [Acidimicrobiaceae bacterium]